MSQSDSLRTTLNKDLAALRAAVPALWDTESDPDMVRDAEHLARSLADGINATNLAAAMDFFQMMGQAEHLDTEMRQRADGAFFLSSFCLTNADVVADEMADA